MQKAIVNMSNWQLYVYDSEYNLEGIGDIHPKLGKNVYIAYTSNVKNYRLEKDVLTYETKNTIYICPLKYMSRNPFRNVVIDYKERLMHLSDTSENCLDKIISAAAAISLSRTSENEFAKHISELQKTGAEELLEKENKEKERLCNIVREYENSVYIEVSQISIGNVLAYHFGHCIGVLKPGIHVGMFQDSILYVKTGKHEEGECSFDFRYFPKGGTMETYIWSDNIERVIIKNEKKCFIKFNDEIIEPQETRIFMKHK